jgi:hypothetical protein
MPLDLNSILPQILTPAIAWAESTALQVGQEGEPLTAGGLALASRVGVRLPHLIRTKLVDHLPVPDKPLLREAACQVGLLGPGATALTLGHSILIVDGHMSTRLLSHECRHAYQYEAYGSIAEFLHEYIGQIIEFGYDDALLEMDARAHEESGVF